MTGTSAFEWRPSARNTSPTNAAAGATAAVADGARQATRSVAAVRTAKTTMAALAWKLASTISTAPNRYAASDPEETHSTLSSSLDGPNRKPHTTSKAA